jgi:putative spermidine/putrescine transport system permease protein
VDQVTLARFWAWGTLVLGIVFFALPLIGMTEFSLKMRRGEYSLDAYRTVLEDPRFQATFGYSALMALITIVFGVLLIVPTAYWVRLRLPHLRPVVEFVTLLPLVIPPIVIAFGYIRLYNTSSFLPLTGSASGTNILLMFGYATLSLPYMYRAVDTGLRAIDVATLTEAAQSLGAGWGGIVFRVILPNVLVAVLSGAFLTFAICIGEYVFAALLDRPAFGPYLVWSGDNKAYVPQALAVLTFAITWTCMGLIQLLTRLSRHTQAPR